MTESESSVGRQPSFPSFARERAIGVSGFFISWALAGPTLPGICLWSCMSILFPLPPPPPNADIEISDKATSRANGSGYVEGAGSGKSIRGRLAHVAFFLLLFLSTLIGDLARQN